MSYGVAVCSKCRHEIHQDGSLDEKTNRYAWRHCEGKTPLCEGAVMEYAGPGEPRGIFCGMDDL